MIIRTGTFDGTHHYGRWFQFYRFGGWQIIELWFGNKYLIVSR